MHLLKFSPNASKVAVWLGIRSRRKWREVECDLRQKGMRTFDTVHRDVWIRAGVEKKNAKNVPPCRLSFYTDVGPASVTINQTTQFCIWTFCTVHNVTWNKGVKFPPWTDCVKRASFAFVVRNDWGGQPTCPLTYSSWLVCNVEYELAPWKTMPILSSDCFCRWVYR